METRPLGDVSDVRPRAGCAIFRTWSRWKRRLPKLRKRKPTRLATWYDVRCPNSRLLFFATTKVTMAGRVVGHTDSVCGATLRRATSVPISHKQRIPPIQYIAVMSYSCNDNQNYFVSETGRTTSRVLNPPGGAASFSLGYDAPVSSSSPPGAAKKQEPSIQQPSGEFSRQNFYLRNRLSNQ